MEEEILESLKWIQIYLSVIAGFTILGFWVK